MTGADPNSTDDWAAECLGHRFSDKLLLTTSLTHTSLNHRTNASATYERLEFLGDRVLGCVIAHWLYEHFPQDGEGKLARRLAELVRGETCAAIARRIGAADHVRLERAAHANHVHESDSTLGDVCEALIGALYVDAGMAVAERFIRAQWSDLIDAETAATKDAKSALQEWAQAHGLPLPHYHLAGQIGPDHAPLFQVDLLVEGFPPERAEGHSKQEAQKRAASQLLAKLPSLSRQ